MCVLKISSIKQIDAVHRIIANSMSRQVGFFKKKPIKRSAAVCYKIFPFALDSSVVDSLVRH